MTSFVPPRPKAHQGMLSLASRVMFALRDNLGFLRERNYSMKMANYRAPGVELFVVNEPRLARSILIDRWELFPKGSVLRRMLQPAIGRGVLGTVGEEWKRQRRMIDPALDQRSMEELFPLMQDAVDAMLQRFAAHPPGTVLDFDVEMTHVTGDAICRAIFSVPFDRRDAGLMFDAFNRYQTAVLPFSFLRLLRLPPLLTATGWRMRRATADLRRLVESFARERYDADRRGRPDGGRDILGSLIAARDPETGAVFGFDELIDHLIVLFIAGHETTASALSWAFYCLARCPEVQERVAREVSETAGTRRLQYGDVRKLKLTRDVFRETLRLYPPIAYLVRESSEAAEFRGKPVCPGATVVVSPWLMHRHRDLWDRPDEFDPDRFAGDSAKASLKKAYLPFSLGPRGCPGASFAMQETTLVIASLISRYRLVPVDGHTPEPAARLTVRSRNGVKLRLQPAGGLVMQKLVEPPAEYSPPAPVPPPKRVSLAARWLKGRHCTISFLAAKSYDSKLGHVRLPGHDLYTVCEPGLVRRILIEQWERFPKNRALARVLKPLLGDGVVISSGELWKMQRRMIDPAFEEVRLRDVFPLMLEAVEAMQRRLDGLAEGSVVAFDEETTHVTADIIFRTIFSVPLEQDDASRVFREFMRYQKHAANAWLVGNAGLPSFLSPSHYLTNWSGRRVRGLLEPLVRSRFEAWQAGRPGDHKDILASLLAAKDPVTGHVFSFDELVDQVATLFLAGHETTAGALSWSVYLAAMCPHVQERLHEEANAVMGGRDPLYSDLKRLKITRDVFREALRLYPPFAFIARTCAHHEEMREKAVKAGSSVTVAPWLIHRHRTHWERPDVFDPDRFQTASGKQSLRQAYLPFSLGPRVCLGASFAMQEAALILSSLVRRYRFEALPDHVPKPIGRLTVRSANGIKLRIFRRQP